MPIARVLGKLRRPPASHAAVVYAGDFPYDHLLEVIWAARHAGNPVVLLLTAAPRKALRARLGDDAGIHYLATEDAIASGTVEGRVRPDRLVEIVGPVFDEARRAGKRLRLITDAAGHLCMTGRAKESHALEDLCSSMCHDGGVKLVCVYPVEALRLRGRRLGRDHGIVESP